MNLCERRDTNQNRQRLPVAFPSVGLDRTKPKRSEARATEALERVQLHQHVSGILQGQAVLQTQQNVERPVFGSYFNFFGMLEYFRGLAFHQERELPILREFLGATKADSQRGGPRIDVFRNQV